MTGIKVERVDTVKRLLDEDKGVGVEIQMIQRKLYQRVDIKTYNKNGWSDRTERFYTPNFGFKYILRHQINYYFKKIKHRYIEWGLSEEQAQFPWKEK
ncbi:hypothetical protein EBB07_28615 [Paenibacillaceae bacterium]|nr:hypothetical protein EBB07_28615 [Paenibacillaceae bacterium]